MELMALSQEERKRRKRLSDDAYQRSPAGRAAQKRTRDRLAKDPHRKAYQFEAMIKHHYGLDAEDWARMYESQNRLCLICSEFMSISFNICVDHDHNTNKVRGMLCRRCNRAIGLFNDRPDLLKCAVKYLEDRQ